MSQNLTGDKSTLVKVMAWVVRQQAITWASVDTDLCRHIASPRPRWFHIVYTIKQLPGLLCKSHACPSANELAIKDIVKCPKPNHDKTKHSANESDISGGVLWLIPRYWLANCNNFYFILKWVFICWYYLLCDFQHMLSLLKDVIENALMFQCYCLPFT